MEKVFDYYAFISYKHEDEKWAKWLQDRLESYRLPTAVRKENKDCPKRVKPVCRDNTDMKPGNLEKEITEKLETSRYLIVICSKNLAKESEYVDLEINTFIESGRADKIIPFVVDGEPNSDNPAEECFNKILRNLDFDILAANAKKDGKYIASLKVVAAILHLSADALIERDKKRQRNRKIFTSIMTVVVMVFLYIMLGLTFENFEKEALNANLYNKSALAIENAIRSLTVPFHKRSDSQAAQILRSEVIAKKLKQTNSQLHKEFEIMPHHDCVYYYGDTPDGELVGFTDLSNVMVYDSDTAEEKGIYSLRNDKELLENMFGFKIEDHDFYGYDVLYEKKNEKYEEELSGSFLYIIGPGGKCEDLYYIDEKTASWTFSENEDIFAICRGETHRTIEIYAFEKDKNISLYIPDEYTGISNMFLSPEGKYLFVNFYIKDEKGFYSERAMCVFDIESCQIVFEHKADESYRFTSYAWSFSKVDKEAFYVFDVRKIEKYSFKDKSPDIGDNVISVNDSGERILSENSKASAVYISDDSNRSLLVNNIYGKNMDDSILYSFFEPASGNTYMRVLFERFKNVIDITPDIRYTVFYIDGKVKIYDIVNSDVLYEADDGYAEITSVGISEDGEHAAYINEWSELTVLEKINGEYVPKEVTDFDYNVYQKVILSVNNEKCVYVINDKMYCYYFETGNTKYVRDEYGYNNSYSYMSVYDTFKSKKLLKDNLFLYPDPVSGGYNFYDMESGEFCSADLFLLPGEYFAETGLYAGAEYTNQEQYNNEIVVMKFDKNNNEVLYRYMADTEVSDVIFDNEGKYIIINGKNGCEVLDALSGNLLFALDRNIIINNDIVYDISSDLILPDVLPHAEIYSLNGFIREGKKLIK